MCSTTFILSLEQGCIVYLIYPNLLQTLKNFICQDNPEHFFYLQPIVVSSKLMIRWFQIPRQTDWPHCHPINQVNGSLSALRQQKLIAALKPMFPVVVNALRTRHGEYLWPTSEVFLLLFLLLLPPSSSTFLEWYLANQMTRAKLCPLFRRRN